MNTVTSYFFTSMLMLPIIGTLLSSFAPKFPLFSARCAGYLVGLSFLLSLLLLTSLSQSQSLDSYPLMSLSTLNALLGSLVLLVSFVVHRFSLKYLEGDRRYRHYFILLSGLTVSLLFMVFADNVFLLWGAAFISNALLVLLMVHKKEWNAARNSGVLAFKTFLVGSLCLLVAFIALSTSASTGSIELIMQHANSINSTVLTLSMALILVSSVIQSALWPSHRWLISSLNTPTPISAFMHAGLVNGGGILIVKFGPLLILQPGLLSVLFLLGGISGVLATVWKLLQPDIKKMLACSTIAQMGFMMMQCGLGLFAAAIAHLCWHGLFKAYLFLSSGSALIQKKSNARLSDASPLLVMVSLIGGLVATLGFAFTSNKILSVTDASAFVLYFAFIAGSDLMLSWIRSYRSYPSVISGILVSAFFGFMYGFSVQVVTWLVPSLSSIPTLPLASFHWFIMSLFGCLWFLHKLSAYHNIWRSKFGSWLYVNLLNSSQPTPNTTTALRSDYQY